jgi:nitroreductase
MTASFNRTTRREAVAALDSAARASLHAPSVFNTQPWRWRIDGDVMELYADRDRRLSYTDRDGRLLMLSCGAALHHARIALAASGWAVRVDRLPDENRPDLLARLHLGKQIPADPEAVMMAGALKRRRSDRRAFADRAVSPEAITRFRRFVESEGAYLHEVRPDQIAMVAASTETAAKAEIDDPRYREELRTWTSRPQWSGDGVPPATAVEPSLRRVPVRDFVPGGKPGLTAGPAVDKGATFVIVWGRSDEPIDLLRGGEALSALLLKATAEGLATAPLSDSIEVEWPRRLLHGLLDDLGEPYLVVRLGYRASTDLPPASPRRDPAEVIDIVNP